MHFNVYKCVTKVKVGNECLVFFANKREMFLCHFLSFWYLHEKGLDVVTLFFSSFFHAMNL